MSSRYSRYFAPCILFIFKNWAATKRNISNKTINPKQQNLQNYNQELNVHWKSYVHPRGLHTVINIRTLGSTFSSYSIPLLVLQILIIYVANRASKAKKLNHWTNFCFPNLKNTHLMFIRCGSLIDWIYRINRIFHRCQMKNGILNWRNWFTLRTQLIGHFANLLVLPVLWYISTNNYFEKK